MFKMMRFASLEFPMGHEGDEIVDDAMYILMNYLSCPLIIK